MGFRAYAEGFGFNGQTYKSGLMKLPNGKGGGGVDQEKDHVLRSLRIPVLKACSTGPNATEHGPGESYTIAIHGLYRHYNT